MLPRAAIFNGGGIYVEPNAKLTRNTTSVSENTRAQNGDGLFVDGILVVTGGQISGNLASFLGGGTYCSGTAGAATLADANLNCNIAQVSGGGVYGGGGTLIISGGAFLNNTAELDGGGLYFASASVINATTFIDNTARTGGGVGNYGNMNVSNSVLHGNTAVLFGGGQSDINAAALLTMSSTTVSGNATCNLLAARCQGGGIFNRRGAMRLVNSTISSKQGVVGGVAISFGSVSARNTIIAGNLAVEGGTSIDVEGVSYSSGNNLIGNNFESTFFSAAGDVTRTRAAPVDRRRATTRQLRRYNAHAVAVF